MYWQVRTEGKVKGSSMSSCRRMNQKEECKCVTTGDAGNEAKQQRQTKCEGDERAAPVNFDLCPLVFLKNERVTAGKGES